MAQLRIRSLEPAATPPKLRIRQLAPYVDPMDQIRRDQAAKFPTSAEQGGPQGQAQQAGLGWKAVGAAIDPLVSPETIETAIRYAPTSLRPSPFIQKPPELNPTGKAGAEMIAGMTSPVELAMGPVLGKLGKAGVVGDKLTLAKQKMARLKLPSEARAGEKFQQVLGAAKDVPLDVTKADETLRRAKELRARGSTMPKVLTDYGKARTSATGTTQFSDPMTYETGRDFASNAGALSVRETTAMNRKMQGQVSAFAKAMRDATREAAVKVGKGDLYDEAMKEYRLARSIQEKKEILKKWGKRAALGATGYALLRDITE